MKLSKLSTENASDVLCVIAPCLTNIMSDEELMAELKSALDFAKATTMAEKIALVAAKAGKMVPILFKKRKAEVFTILAALNEKSVEAVKKQNILVTMSQIRDLTKDKELLDFFKSCTGTEESE